MIKKCRYLTATLLVFVTLLFVSVLLMQFNRRFVKAYADESVEEYNIDLAQSVVNDVK